MRPFQIRRLVAADEAIVWSMLMHAAHESDLMTVRQSPILARYALDWGRQGDLGFAGFWEDRPMGAAWVRLWPEGDQGFGYMGDDIPELAFAVVPEFRGRGYGTMLLKTLLAMAADHYPAISLNVRAENPAVRLYQRLGFMPVPGSEVTNRLGGVSYNMIYRFPAPLH